MLTQLILTLALASSGQQTEPGTVTLDQNWTEPASLAGTWLYRPGDDLSWADGASTTGWATTQIPDLEKPPLDTLGQPYVWYRRTLRLSKKAQADLHREPRP